MNQGVIFQQIIMICFMIVIGYVLYKTSNLDEHSSKHIAGVISYVCYPSVLLYSALSNTTNIGKDDFV